MLLVFRLYRRHQGSTTEDTHFSADLYNFLGTAVHLRHTQGHLYRLYDMELLFEPIAAFADDNDNVTMSPMEMELMVFIKGNEKDHANVEYWFSFFDIWHFLYNKDRIHPIAIDERMSGHFIYWENLLAESNMADQDTATDHPFPLAFPPIAKNTIFISTLGLWHFIFSSPDIQRGLLLGHLLEKEIYPMMTSISLHNETAPTDPLLAVVSDTSRANAAGPCSWFTRCLNFFHEPSVNHAPPAEQGLCLSLLIRHCDYLREQIDILQRQASELQQHTQQCARCHANNTPRTRPPLATQNRSRETTV